MIPSFWPRVNQQMRCEASKMSSRRLRRGAAAEACASQHHHQHQWHHLHEAISRESELPSSEDDDDDKMLWMRQEELRIAAADEGMEIETVEDPSPQDLIAELAYNLSVEPRLFSEPIVPHKPRQLRQLEK
eukprot:6315487-Karenia_brevis.AAC.1